MNASLEFFDPTKWFGYTNDRRCQFATPADVLAYMDRQGIARAIVYQQEGRMFHPGPSNRWLLEGLDATPHHGRLIPAAMIAPIMRYNAGSLAELKAAMAEGRIRALRYFASGHYSLPLIEPVIEELLPYQPVLFFESQYAPAWDELSDFAARFPRLPLVYMQAMWPSELNLAHLLEKHENFHVDTSWMHTDLTLEFLVRRFGAERIVFGAGPDAFNAAAIGALLYAELSHEVKAQIAQGNLARLLGMGDLPPTGITPLTAARDDKPLWRAYLRGEKLDIDIVDSHAHPVIGHTWLRESVDADECAARLLQQKDRIGVATTCIATTRAMAGDAIADHADTEARLSKHPGRFLGYVVYNPFQTERVHAHLEDYFSRDYYVGFKLLNDYWKIPITDPRFNPMWKYADEHAMPILMHTWISPYNDPAMLQDIVPAHPNAQFILGHSGGSNHDSAIALAQANPNVYLEWCGSFVSQEPWEPVIAAVGADRVLFGSDTMPHNLDWEFARFLSLDLPDKEIVPMLGANMRRILAKRR